MALIGLNMLEGLVAKRHSSPMSLLRCRVWLRCWTVNGEGPKVLDWSKASLSVQVSWRTVLELHWSCRQLPTSTWWNVYRHCICSLESLGNASSTRKRCQRINGDPNDNTRGVKWLSRQWQYTWLSPERARSWPEHLRWDHEQMHTCPAPLAAALLVSS